MYDDDFYGLSNNVLHVLGTKLFLRKFAFEIRQCNTIYAMRTSDGMFLINKKCVS